VLELAAHTGLSLGRADLLGCGVSGRLRQGWWERRRGERQLRPECFRRSAARVMS
jgi:hypothetical protein